MIRRFNTDEAARILCVEKHNMKPLRETGFLVGTRSGHGYVYDEEELDAFVRLTRGYDLSNPEKIRIAAAIIKPHKKMPHPKVG